MNIIQRCFPFVIIYQACIGCGSLTNILDQAIGRNHTFYAFPAISGNISVGNIQPSIIDTFSNCVSKHCSARSFQV